jgi:hypothetical protein
MAYSKGRLKAIGGKDLLLSDYSEYDVHQSNVYKWALL